MWKSDPGSKVWYVGGFPRGERGEGSWEQGPGLYGATEWHTHRLYVMNMHEGGPTGGSHYCVKSLTAPYLVYMRCPGALLI